MHYSKKIFYLDFILFIYVLWNFFKKKMEKCTDNKGYSNSDVCSKCTNP